MPPNKRRPARRFSFESDRYPKWEIVMPIVRRLIIQQRNHLRQNCSHEATRRRQRLKQIELQRKKFLVPSTSAETTLRLQNLEKLLQIQHQKRELALQCLQDLQHLFTLTPAYQLDPASTSVPNQATQNLTSEWGSSTHWMNVSILPTRCTDYTSSQSYSLTDVSHSPSNIDSYEQKPTSDRQ